MTASVPITGIVVWLTGRPGSGKTTLARLAQRDLRNDGVQCCVLDGDDLRPVLVPDAGYDEASRDRFYTALGRLAVYLAHEELVVLVSATAPRRAYRDAARAQAPAFVEVHVECDETTCVARDPKGLYAAARAGRITTLPGAQAVYETPLAAEVTVRTADATAEECSAAVVDAVVRMRRCDPPPD